MYKLTIVLVFFLLLLGCQTKLDKAGYRHAADITAWRELARYSNIELSYWGLTITANIQVVEGTEGLEYELKNIKLSPINGNSDLDLLSSQFMTRFACKDDCKSLSKYNTKEQFLGSLLSNFFEQQEGQFFRFYGRLTQLSDHMNLLKSESPSETKKYLNWIVEKNESFNSLGEFIGYFEEMLEADKFITFIENSNIFESGNRYELDSYPNDGINQETAMTDINDLPYRETVMNDINDLPYGETAMTDINDLPYREGSNGIPNGILNTNFSVETPYKQVIQSLIEQEESKLPHSYQKQQTWLFAKTKKINEGDWVCTFSDNSFGVVKVISKDTVLLKIHGQARHIIDGVKLMPLAGHLFSENKDFYFIKKQLEQSYRLSDVAPCGIDYVQYNN
ncbi:hypothetical protein KO505_03950 [Psychrosphaera sp. F3M07]|uniref:hypothetical protein n=1 Tax=Psychrosphaera sp. F3M07 TaxID=2841560 RepID=UPI001C09D7DA|nr:hypothetical protein [Psychrosphaera sp. F3M07]MBU2917116.1 hypothetical protein [Psychrosphaera sp. F3M07]